MYMQKKKLVIFFGKPGAGKSTLITETFLDNKVVDVKPFVLAYKKNDVLPEEKTLNGYKDMYKALTDMEDDLIVVELGTNHEAYNIERLQDLASERQIFIFLCTASVETLRQRIQLRDEKINPEALERRLERDFPGQYITLLEEAGMHYVLLDMEQPWTDNLILVHQRLRDDE